MTALVGVFDDIRLNLKLNRPTILVPLEVFLRFPYLGGGACFILSFSRHQRVGCGDDFSSLAPVGAGDPQSSHILLLCLS
jgi:hypothetical protein